MKKSTFRKLPATVTNRLHSLTEESIRAAGADVQSLARESGLTVEEFQVRALELKSLSVMMLTMLSSAEEIKDWCQLFLGLDFPMGHIDPDSNSSPIEAMWEIYSTVRDNKGDVRPGFIMLSAREGYKTLSAAALEVLLLLHFQTTISHMAAIQTQSNKAVSYINAFFKKLEPLTQTAGWINTSSTKTRIEFNTPEGKTPYITVIICTMTGANCVSPDSMVRLSDGSSVRAAEISPGAMVLSWDAKDLCHKNVRVAGIAIAKKHARKICLADGRDLIVSDDHPVFTHRGWVSASQVRLGDKMQPLIGEPTHKSWVPVMDHQNKRTLEQMVLGTLMGDASLNILPSGSVRYQVSRSVKNMDYIRATRSVLERSGICCHTYVDNRGIVKLTTQVHPYFEEINRLIKRNGVKTISAEWLDRIKPEGLAYFLQDDGSANMQEVGLYKDHAFRIASFGFTLEGNEMLASWLGKIGYPAKVVKSTNQTKKVYTGLAMDMATSRKLSELVSPYFVPSMRYKLLAPTAEVGATFTIDSMDRVFLSRRPSGFAYTDKKVPNTKTGRRWLRRVRKAASLEVVHIEPVGMQDLVDVVLDTENPHLKNFYANGVLVHNSEHTNLMFIDEIDVVRDPMAYNEAKLIAGEFEGQFPVTVKLSTRKFAFGLMQKELDEAKEAGEEVLRWNIMDVTGKCPKERHMPHLPKVDLYAPKQLPLNKHLTREKWKLLPEADKEKYDLVKKAHAGCATCPLFTVCRTRLASRPDEDSGGLYKRIPTIINSFRKVPPDMGEAQLMCWKPSSKGLIYPRFENAFTEGNILKLEDAFTVVSGEKMPGITLDQLVAYLHSMGVKIVAGLDWGFRHEYAITVWAIIPNGQVWILHTYGEPGQEFPDQLKTGIELRDRFKVNKWYPDTAMPGNIKTFKKNGMPCPDFTKDVMGGINAVRSKIVDGLGRRWLKVLDTPENQKVITGFRVHHFVLDNAGNVTKTPDDEEYADVMDTVRYVGQNEFPIEGKGRGVTMTTADGSEPSAPKEERKEQATEHSKQMKQEIQKRLGPNSGAVKKGGKRGGFFFDV